MKEQLAKVADAATAAGQEIYAFAKEQAPELIKEIITWHIASNAIIFAISTVIVVLAAIAIKHCYKVITGDSTSFGGEEFAFAGIITSAVILFFSSVSMAIHALDAVKGIASPRLVVLEKISEVTKIGKNK